MMNRYSDWLEQAKRDLDAAKSSRESHHYEWTCFQAQQSAEKAMKALLIILKVDAWGHGLVHLLNRLSEVININKG
jgi:HEPN domain-containing protein